MPDALHTAARAAAQHIGLPWADGLPDRPTVGEVYEHICALGCTRQLIDRPDGTLGQTADYLGARGTWLLFTSEHVAVLDRGKLLNARGHMRQQCNLAVKLLLP